MSGKPDGGPGGPDTSDVDVTRARASGARQTETIGPYRLLQRVGEGGMGEVWLAEQAQPIHRQVAVKIIKAGMDTAQVVARFEAERQALAIMSHPAIAQVLDAGATDSGRPFFAMEYVRGEPITAYCNRCQLSTRQRIELFLQVCEGVTHAHQKGIIHRDLKPSNILVTELDGRAIPKIIDFGLAKAMTLSLTDRTLHTELGTLIGTPEYMSPEQAEVTSLDVDTRSDVYTLGVILYELLSGVLPFDARALRAQSLDEIRRTIREVEPPRPSTRLSNRAQSAGPRDTDRAGRVAVELRGELDWIIMRALEKERGRRYQTVNGLARDLQRHLEGETVEAAPPSATYRARKFARRYRVALATTAAFVVVLAAAAVVSIRQSIRANRAAAAAQAVNDFLQNDLLAQASASNQAGPGATPELHLEVRTALDRAATRIAGKFERQPEVEADIRATIGRTYTDLGLYAEARRHLERALELQRRLLGSENPRTMDTVGALASTAAYQGASAEAETLLSGILPIQRRVLGPEHPKTLLSMVSLANTFYLQGKHAQAEAMDAQLLAIQRRVVGPEHPDTLKTMNNLALVYHDEGKFTQSEDMYRELVEIRRRVLGPDHPDTARSIGNLARAYWSEGKVDQAQGLYLQALEILRRVQGPDHPNTALIMNNLVLTEVAQRHYTEAEALAKQVLEIRRRVLGPEHPDTLQSLHNLAWVEQLQGRYAASEELYHQTIEARRRVLGAEHPKTLLSIRNLADIYIEEGKYARAEAVLKENLDATRRVEGAGHPDTLYAISALRALYQQQGKYDLAEDYALQAFEGRKRTLGAEHPDTMSSGADLALAYVSQRKFVESEPLAREAVEFTRKKQPDDSGRFFAESLLGASLAGQKKFAEAEPLLVAAYQGMLARKDGVGVGDRWQMDQMRAWIVQLYTDSGQPRKAAEWRAKLPKDAAAKPSS